MRQQGAGNLHRYHAVRSTSTRRRRKKTSTSNRQASKQKTSEQTDQKKKKRQANRRTNERTKNRTYKNIRKCRLLVFAAVVAVFIANERGMLASPEQCRLQRSPETNQAQAPPAKQNFKWTSARTKRSRAPPASHQTLKLGKKSSRHQNNNTK